MPPGPETPIPVPSDPRAARLEGGPIPVPESLMQRHLVNLIAFLIGWLACVLGGAHGWPWLGVAVMTLVATLHLATSTRPGRESLLLLSVACLGALWDGLAARLGFLEYSLGMPLPWLPPVWVIALWVGFATTLNGSLGWLRGRWYWALGLGAVGGPLVYWTGMTLGGVRFPDPVATVAVLAGGWSFLMPFTSWLALRLSGQLVRVPRTTPGGDGAGGR